MTLDRFARQIEGSGRKQAAARKARPTVWRYAALLGAGGWLLVVPVPFSLLHIGIGLIQAYIFGMLTLVFIAGGIGPHPDTDSRASVGSEGQNVHQIHP